MSMYNIDNAYLSAPLYNVARNMPEKPVAFLKLLFTKKARICNSIRMHCRKIVWEMSLSVS